jgi:hypothetical protein
VRGRIIGVFALVAFTSAHRSALKQVLLWADTNYFEQIRVLKAGL